jgi:hypothetical protein
VISPFQSSFQLEEHSSTNFVNPVYENMFADVEEDLLNSGGEERPILRVPVSPVAVAVDKGRDFITLNYKEVRQHLSDYYMFLMGMQSYQLYLKLAT